MMLLSAFPSAASAALSPHELVPFTIVLTRQRPHALAEAVAAVSDPGSARFRRYLGDASIAQLLQPTAPTIVKGQCVIWVIIASPAMISAASDVRKTSRTSRMRCSIKLSASAISRIVSVGWQGRCAHQGTVVG